VRNPWGCAVALLLAAVVAGFLLGRSSRLTSPAGSYSVARPPGDRPAGEQPAVGPAPPRDRPAHSAAAPEWRRGHPPRRPADHAAGRAVIIIDDLGASRQACERFLRLPADLTFSFLPDAPLAQTLSAQVAAQGRCVLLHLPMEPVAKNERLEPDTITTRMSASEIDAAVRAALAAVPSAVGVNNHMGSRATTDEDVMRAVLRPLAERGLFFVDSRTIPHSVAPRVAQQLGVPLLARDVFLDPEPQRDAAQVMANMQALAHLARAQGLAVGIGHPFTATAEGIERGLAYFDQTGVQVVAASDAL